MPKRESDTANLDTTINLVVQRELNIFTWRNDTVSFPVESTKGNSAEFFYAVENDTLNLSERVSNRFVWEHRLDSLYSSWQPIAHIQNEPKKIVAWSVPRGEGQFIYITSVAHFTNYCLSNPDNFNYVSDITTYFPTGFYHAQYFDRNLDDPGKGPMQGSSSPLAFIMSERSLRWAWYSMIVGLILFVVLRIKRQQRIIPLMPKKRNQTLAFAQNIGMLRARGREKQARLALEIHIQFNRGG